MVLVLKYVSFTIKSSSLCFYLRWNGCALIIKLQESGKQKEINFWWNKYCSGFPHCTPIAVIEEMKYLLQFPQIITLRRFTWPTENCTPLCTPHIPALYGTTSADSVPVITLEWRDFVGSPVAWFLPGAVWPFFSVCWMRKQWTEEFPSLVWSLGLLDFLTRFAERSHHKTEEAGYHSPWQFSPFAERTHILTILHVCHWVLCTLSRQIRLLSVNTDENTKA